MKFKYYQVDSFTNKIFKMQSYFVVQLDEWLEDEILLKNSSRKCVMETAFYFRCKWF